MPKVCVMRIWDSKTRYITSQKIMCHKKLQVSLLFKFMSPFRVCITNTQYSKKQKNLEFCTCYNEKLLVFLVFKFIYNYYNINVRIQYLLLLSFIYCNVEIVFRLLFGVLIGWENTCFQTVSKVLNFLLLSCSN